MILIGTSLTMENQVFPRKQSLLVSMVLLMVSQMQAVSSVPLACPRPFGQQVQQCLDPYWSAALLFNTDGPGHRHRHRLTPALAHHLCLQFEMALACIHTALRQCPSHTNIRYVQSKLGSDWVMDIRDLCVGQSGLATNQVPDEQLDDLLDSSNELLQDYLTDIVDDTGDDDGEVYTDAREEIFVVVPDKKEGVYHGRDIGVEIRHTVTSQARPRHLASRPIDVNVFNIFEGDKQTTSAGSHVIDRTLCCWIVFMVFVLAGAGLCW